jgi:D-3-phosphoglycerate dehydrogenase
VKVVIARDAPQKTQGLMAAQFPGQWDIVTVGADELIHAVNDADVIIPEGTAIDKGLLKQAKNLKLIQTGAGYDNVDIEACTQRGIWVASAAGANARAVAEQVLAFILCWYKNAVRLDNGMKRGAFHMDYRGAELSGKVIGIVGLGQIGRQSVAQARQCHPVAPLCRGTGWFVFSQKTVPILRRQHQTRYGRQATAKCVKRTHGE